MVELLRLLFDAESDVFRLELLEQYKVDGEWDQFQQYLRGEKVVEDEKFVEFCKFISSSVKQGKNHLRVHVVPETLTPYLKFQIKAGYLPMINAGATIMFISQSKYKDILNKFFNDKFTPSDFWLFDEKIAVELSYDEEGAFLGAKQIKDKSALKNYVELKKVLITQSTNLSDLNLEI